MALLSRVKVFGKLPIGEPIAGAGGFLAARWVDFLQKWLDGSPRILSFDVDIDPPAIAAGTGAEVTVTVVGLPSDAIVFLNKPTRTAGLVMANVRVDDADTLVVQFENITAGPINAGSETYRLTAIRP